MRKLWLGIILGVLIVFLIFRYSEELIEPEEEKNPLDKFTKTSVSYEPDCFGGECSGDAVEWIIENGNISDCQLDEDCRARYAIENDPVRCHTRDCALVTGLENFSDYMYPLIHQLRLSLEFNKNLCDGNMSDFIKEISYKGELISVPEELLLKYSFKEFCGIMLNGCENNLDLNCRKIMNNKYDFDELVEDENRDDVHNYPLIFVNKYLNSTIFSEKDNDEKNLILSKLNDKILNYQYFDEYIPSSIFSINLIFDFFDEKKIEENEYLKIFSISQKIGINKFLKRIVEKGGPKNEFISDLQNCNINQYVTNNLEQIFYSKNPALDGWENVLRNTQIFYFINKSNCSDLNKYKRILNSILFNSKDKGFYYFVENKLPNSLEFIYVFDVENENLENFLFSEFETGRFNNYDLDDLMFLYKYLADD